MYERDERSESDWERRLFNEEIVGDERAEHYTERVQDGRRERLVVHDILEESLPGGSALSSSPPTPLRLPSASTLDPSIFSPVARRLVGCLSERSER